MRDPYAWSDPRRLGPRVAVEGLCNEIAGGAERPALVLDLSPAGLRLERPFVGGRSPRDVQLELEVPEIDEILWARGQVCFDELRRSAGGLVRATGIRLVAAAARDLRLLRDWVMETRRAREPRPPDAWSLADASCYLRG